MSIFVPNNPGTVKFTNGSTAIQGTGTTFTNYKAGSVINLPGRGAMQLASDPVSNTAAVGVATWKAATTAFETYEYVPRNEQATLTVKLAALLDQLGNGNIQALAALALAANKIPYATGGGTLALADLTAWGRSLLDDADAAAFWSTIGATAGAAQAFRRGNVLASVAQSGGTPTGGLIERGSNANGEYVRFADGTQLCTGSTMPSGGPSTASGSLFITAGSTSLTFPAAFVVEPNMFGGSDNTSRIGQAVATSASGGVVREISTASSGTAVLVNWFAFGRWF